MNIVGIDLGTIKSALVTVTGDIGSLSYSSKLIEADKKKPINDRFLEIINTITDYVHALNPELVACEYPFNIKGHARILVELFGCVHYFCLKNNFNFISIPQTTIKKYATGSGKAEKSDLRMQVYKEFNLDYTEDQCDAFFIAHMGKTYLYGDDKKYRQESIDRLKKQK